MRTVNCSCYLSYFLPQSYLDSLFIFAYVRVSYVMYMYVVFLFYLYFCYYCRCFHCICWPVPLSVSLLASLALCVLCSRFCIPT